MRIISGSARGHRLATFRGKDIRPTPDRVREAVFNMLTSRLGPLEGLQVLDLFAGSGGMGLEALSRGAGYAVFVDASREAADLTQRNLKHCRLEKRARVVRSDAQAALVALAGQTFDLVFMDPPYHSGLATQLLPQLVAKGLLSPRAFVVVETDKKETMTGLPAAMELELERHFGRIRIELIRMGATA
ncbi:MAG: 16S rRNA (guanine(966)-N(2))-methyltransferase RsmD [Deltaproteobacteria bacterium]|nr:MAG: 16S rRNA (guanine(966)-N(2))-methyltransferase RsmD [Deltaproteobacteria bacterium]